MLEIGIIPYPGAQQAAVLGLTDLFQVAQTLARQQGQPQDVLKFSHCLPTNEGDGVRRTFDSHPEVDAQMAALILPPSLQAPPAAQVAKPYVPWLQRAHANGTVLCSICAGAFVLAETGLLNGRRATTHWLYANTFRERYPQVLVNTDHLLLHEPDLITAGGIMSWTDLGLQIVERWLGASVMTEAAKLLLLDPPGREQRYYQVFSPNLQHGDVAVLQVQQSLHDTLGRTTSLPQLAAAANLEPRTLMRRFRHATGMTTTEYIQRLRVNKAQHLLQFSRHAVEQIAWEVGYQDVGAFRKVFQKRVGLSPGEYRERFRWRG